jgi:hypothetical protein
MIVQDQTLANWPNDTETPHLPSTPFHDGTNALEGGWPRWNCPDNLMQSDQLEATV